MANTTARPPLVLASASPRRQQLLQDAGYDFKVVSANVVERSGLDLSLAELTVWNAMRKGFFVARKHPAAVVVAADTLVSLDGRIIGKPRDLSDALDILRQLRGRVHQVCTGVFVGRRADSVFSVFREISHVTFKNLNDQALRAYLSSIDPLDKAGAYAAQENGQQIIARIEGSRSNVVGLPIAPTAAALRGFGIPPPGA